MNTFMKRTDKLCTYKKNISKSHIIQSMIAGLYIFFVFWMLHSLRNELVVASLGASAFIVFSFPTAQSSHPRYLIGGYFCGSLSGLTCYGLTILLNNCSLPFPGYVLSCAAAMFLTMLLMTILNLEHPPSAAFAVGITICSEPFILSFAGLACIVALCFIKLLLKKYLRDLQK